MRTVKALAIVAVAVTLAFVGIVLYVDNHTPVTLSLLGKASPPYPVFVWLYAAFLLGALTGFALCFFGFVRGKLKQRRLQRTLRDQERELHQLRDPLANRA